MPMSFEMPELLIYIVPAFAGIIGSRYLSRLANFCVMVAVFSTRSSDLRLHHER